MIFQGIGMMFSGAVPVTGSQGLAGPVGIVQLSAEVVQGGYAPYLWFLALISINLALLNMLPLLPLDGGHFVLSIIDRVRGRTTLVACLRAHIHGRAGSLRPAVPRGHVQRRRPHLHRVLGETGVSSRLQVMVGDVPVGGGAPVVVQSMTNTRTDDVEATLGQIRALATAGARLVRVAVPDQEAARAMSGPGGRVAGAAHRRRALRSHVAVAALRAERPGSGSIRATSGAGKRSGKWWRPRRHAGRSSGWE